MPTSGPPLPKRPKGRLFIAMVIAGLMIFGVRTIYDRTIRYVAYGELQAETLELAAPWQGVVESLHVREGDVVSVGDIIARVDSLELEQKIDSIDDSLRVERAQLASDFAMLRWESEKIHDTRRLAQSDFYDKWSELLWEQSRLSDLRSQEKRLKGLYDDGAAPEERLQTISFQLAGQEKRVEQLTEAVRALRNRGGGDLNLSIEDRVQPTLVRIQNLQQQLDRVRARRLEGEVRSTAGGRILRMHRFVGEYSDQSQPIASILVEGSEMPVLYVPQMMVRDFPVGSELPLYVPSIDRNLRCKVMRHGMQTRKAPDSIARHYNVNQALLPIHLRVDEPGGVPPGLAVGSEIRLPRRETSGWFDRAMLAFRGWFGSADSGYAQIPAANPHDSPTRFRDATDELPMTRSAIVDPATAEGRSDVEA